MVKGSKFGYLGTEKERVLFLYTKYFVNFVCKLVSLLKGNNRLVGNVRCGIKVSWSNFLDNIMMLARLAL